ncbi:hypothetical protein [Halalkalibacter krulwichiae]|uniref:Replication initiator A N-terminal domain-containing protein n=1 Tax=Halalkalibacter krulwichiae TaxID=199441 RepID=A0A1X9M8U9_9BACI|nr:hypothetical protein [Halalkalibacter krulwichiae]ARK29040.1 hypothetical protein BkAM31D_03800 [Halalkalibacter krulwichiae]
MSLISILSGKGFVMFNKDLAHEVSVNGAILFGQLCSSYESFKNKDMLTKKDGKEYFFLTGETVEEETALTYKQQLKAFKELEEAGYIETVLMGQPRRKYFYITDKIFTLFRSDKREELKADINTNEPKEHLEQQRDNDQKGKLLNDKRETLDMTKGNNKRLPLGIAYKNKNKKEQYNNKEIFVNKGVNNKLNNIDDTIHKLSNEYRLKGLNKKVCELVVNEALEKIDTINNFGAYLRICFENTLYKSKLKKGEIDFEERFGRMPFFNWLTKGTEENNFEKVFFQADLNDNVEGYQKENR